MPTGCRRTLNADCLEGELVQAPNQTNPKHQAGTIQEGLTCHRPVSPFRHPS
jgi:hypothetical protein